MNIDTDLLVDFIETNIESAEERMSKASVAKEIVGNLIKSELRSQTADIKNNKERKTVTELLKQTLTKKEPKEPKIKNSKTNTCNNKQTKKTLQKYFRIKF